MIVLDARKSLFLRRGHDLAVNDKTGGGVVIEGRNSKNGCHEGQRAKGKRQKAKGKRQKAKGQRPRASRFALALPLALCPQNSE